ncbi:shikimate kinase [Olsenella massiliensis]|uniref:shikimate kinase n=1 Tax=Olsenella massiliensis TaxID=1622075 RepID=UPI00071C296D|nr:shikimate kinase [Olsenella massiliensis]
MPNGGRRGGGAKGGVEKKQGCKALPGRPAAARLVVNTTPVGMFPACPASPLAEGQIESLTGLKGVLDVVYNPLRTGICLAAERAHVPAESGLAMLVAQAALSAELFLGRAVGDEVIADTLAWLERTTANVLLIGMPGVGKTSAGRALARLVGRPFVDLDDAVDLQCGMSARELLSRHGEDAFRRAETKVAAEHGRRSGLVVACGGGIVTRPENYPLLHQNGTIVLLRRPLSQLSLAGRPLSQACGLERLERERSRLYASWADVTLDCTGSAGSDARALRRLLGL